MISILIDNKKISYFNNAKLNVSASGFSSELTLSYDKNRETENAIKRDSKVIVKIDKTNIFSGYIDNKTEYTRPSDTDIISLIIEPYCNTYTKKYFVFEEYPTTWDGIYSLDYVDILNIKGTNAIEPSYIENRTIADNLSLVAKATDTYLVMNSKGSVFFSKFKPKETRVSLKDLHINSIVKRYAYDNVLPDSRLIDSPLAIKDNSLLVKRHKRDLQLNDNCIIITMALNEDFLNEVKYIAPFTVIFYQNKKIYVSNVLYEFDFNNSSYSLIINGSYI